VLNPVDPGKSETNRSSLRYGLSVSNQGEDKDRVAFPALSSVLDEQALLNRVVCHYDLPHPARECQFFDRGDSDIYRVRTEHAAFYLKVYRPPYAAEQVEQEAQRVHDLAQLGIPVVEPVAQKDGRFVHFHRGFGRGKTHSVVQGGPRRRRERRQRRGSRILGTCRRRPPRRHGSPRLAQA
jgi:hypothetical protein